ncbi:MAG: hypothetical protein SFZ23_02015 [Planctomycetota bacterium]|nr:hypothetical protein [Planctomycetota bacterium]
MDASRYQVNRFGVEASRVSRSDRDVLALTRPDETPARPVEMSNEDAARFSAIAARATASPLDRGFWRIPDSSRLAEIVERTPPEVYEYAVAPGVDPAILQPPERKLIETPAFRVRYKGLHQHAIIRIFEEPRREAARSAGEPSLSDWLDLRMLGFIPNARMMSGRTIAEAERTAAEIASFGVEIVPTPEAPDARIRQVRSDDLWLEAGKPLRIPLGPIEPKPKGLVLHQWALAGNEFEAEVVDELVKRGWATIDLDTESNIRSPVTPAQRERVDALVKEFARLNQEARDATASLNPADPRNDGRWKSLREEQNAWRRYSFQLRQHPSSVAASKVAEEIRKLQRGAFQVCSPEDAARAGQDIAEAVDTVIAGNARAAISVMDYIQTQRPDLQGIPIVYMGFSAGALVTPACVAAIKPYVAAAVMVGGGANLFEISQTSVLTDGGLRVACGDEKLPEKLMPLVSAAYLRSTTLDPYAMAPLLADLPILQVHATGDDWVPAATGDVLWHRLGKPDRLTIGAGHELLFYFLPSKSKRIADWVEEAVFGPGGEQAEAPSSEVATR